jgi:hypothetical protein
VIIQEHAEYGTEFNQWRAASISQKRTVNEIPTVFRLMTQQCADVEGISHRVNGIMTSLEVIFL